MISILTFAAFFACGVNAQKAYDAGTVTTDGNKLNVPVYRIAVVSTSPDVEALAKRVLATHGSFNLTPAANAQFVFTFSKDASGAITLSIKGARDAAKTYTGSDWQSALMKACDSACLATVGTAGYFSGTVAFTYSKGKGASQIYISDIGFQKIRSVTNDPSDSMMPHISPDGSKISYTGYFRSGFMDLFEINLNTKTRRTLASYKGSNTGGAYSPNGSKIAMVLSSSGNAEIWIADSGLKTFKRLTKTSATEASVSFSPDGNSIVYSSDPDGGPRIYTMPATGGKASVVNTNISRYCSEPAWNPVDTGKIAFTAAVGKGFQIALYEQAKRSSRFITSDSNTSWPTWLNDGRHLICTKTNGASKSLWIVDSETGKQTRLHSAEFGSASESSFFYPNR